MMRIGHGYDAHQFADGRKLILGGVSIPYEKGLQAHSDGDAAIHALCDALLGAAGLGDIGSHFPDTDARYENIDSRVLLRSVVCRLAELDLLVVNADLTILAQAPKLSPYLAEMRDNLAGDMGIDSGCVNIKATTTEAMGFVGRKEGIAAYAVALLQGSV